MITEKYVMHKGTCEICGSEVMYKQEPDFRTVIAMIVCPNCKGKVMVGEVLEDCQEKTLELNSYRSHDVKYRLRNISKYTGKYREMLWKDYDKRKEHLDICIAVEQMTQLLEHLYLWAVKDGLIKENKND